MKRILIANRGEIARRVIATARRMGLETVAVYSDADIGALHVREATLACALGGNASADSYLRVDKLLAAARASGADAVHPGYGFLSEDAEFAQAVLDAGLGWIGPPPVATRALGNKAAAKQLAAAHGVPCLPGYGGADQSEAHFIAEAARVGYPLMVKAVAGGGGRGMRLAQTAADLPQALASARSEALAGFGNGDLLIERALLHPRHIEVQVFADCHGNVIHLGERDCSVQRRHQKIIEESPSPAITPQLRERIGAAAVALARAAGYVGAGTVEFLFAEGEFFLMEMNTRLQVEHTVTEQLAGVDLVEWQIRVARGERLPLTQEQVRLQGHAIEVRLCAEDEDCVPRAGRILHLQTPPAAEFVHAPLRFDHCIEPGTEVTPYYDSMIGKLIAHAPSRAEAIGALLAALGSTQVLGLPTNRRLLMACLDDERFRGGDALISFLEQHGAALRERLLREEETAHGLWAAAALHAAGTGDLPPALAAPLRLAHREQVTTPLVRACAGGIEILGEAAHTLHIAPLADGSADCYADNSANSHADGHADSSADSSANSHADAVGTRLRAVAVEPAAGNTAPRWHAQAGAVDWWFDDLSLEAASAGGRGQAETELKAPFNGKVVRLAVQPGERLATGQAAVVIESMKLEHSLAPRGEVTVAQVLVEVGQQVAPGQLLLRFEVQAGGEKAAA